MSIEPDTKDWTWVLERRCPECGEDSHRIQAQQVADLVRQAAVQWERVLVSTPNLRSRPRPDVWSPLEYGCHVRDVLRVFDQRLEQMLTEENPEFRSWDQDHAAAQGRYDQQEAHRLALELAEAARTLADRFETVTPDAWDRPGRRSDGSQFTVLTLARYLLHDIVHHLHDVRFAHREPRA